MKNDVEEKEKDSGTTARVRKERRPNLGSRMGLASHGSRPIRNRGHLLLQIEGKLLAPTGAGGDSVALLKYTTHGKTEYRKGQMNDEENR